MAKEPGDPQYREEESKKEPRSEESYKAEAEESERIAQYFVGLNKVYDIEKEIRRREKIISDKRKEIEAGQGNQESGNIIKYCENCIELGRAELERRKEKPAK